MSTVRRDLPVKVEDLQDGAQLANRLFYDYLCVIRKHQKGVLRDVLSDAKLDQGYDPYYAYGNHYRDYLLGMQRMLTKTMSDKDRAQLHQLFLAFYENDNQALKTTARWIQMHTRTRDGIRQAAKARSRGINFTNPVKADSALSALNALMGAWYQPMLSGSIPTIRRYASDLGFTELRFGTQVEVINGRVRINPIFEAYLAAKKTEDPDKITNIYFNALKHGTGAMERLREGSFTRALHQLEDRHSNLAVITLPADGGLLTRRHVADSRSILSKALAVREIKALALDDSSMDFHISNKIRTKIGLNEVKIDELLEESLKKLGLTGDGHTMISPAQRQALMFHFIKFELTSFIIERLSPEAVNFTCKDAIDRGGAHSLYFNLLKSLEPGRTPMTKKEFMEGLDAAPTYVKGRAMNTHANLVWNAVDKYIAAHTETDERFQEGGNMRWLVEWRDSNRPKKERKSVKVSCRLVGSKEEQYDFSAQKHRRHHEISFHFAAFLLKMFCKIVSFFAVCSQMRGASTESYREPVASPSPSIETTGLPQSAKYISPGVYTAYGQERVVAPQEASDPQPDPAESTPGGPGAGGVGS